MMIISLFRFTSGFSQKYSNNLIVRYFFLACSAVHYGKTKNVCFWVAIVKKHQLAVTPNSFDGASCCLRIERDNIHIREFVVGWFTKRAFAWDLYKKVAFALKIRFVFFYLQLRRMTKSKKVKLLADFLKKKRRNCHHKSWVFWTRDSALSPIWLRMKLMCKRNFLMVGQIPNSPIFVAVSVEETAELWRNKLTTTQTTLMTILNSMTRWIELKVMMKRGPRREGTANRESQVSLLASRVASLLVF